MTLTDFINTNKTAIQSFGHKAASPFKLFYQEAHWDLEQFRNHMKEHLHLMIELDIIDAGVMTVIQATTILFDGIEPTNQINHLI